MEGMGYLGYKDLADLQGGQLDPLGPVDLLDPPDLPDLPDPPYLLDPLEMLDPPVGVPSTPGGGRVPAHQWGEPR